ncbi:MAG: hypothetical protein R3C11_11975 [Planctomycetaceae bacterium]
METIELNLLSTNSALLPARLVIEELSDDQESQVHITLSWAAESLTVESHAEFFALCELRQKLQETGLSPLCFGAAENVYPSGMSLSMSGGRMAYRMTPGKQARMQDLVDIFDTEPDLVPVTVEAQKAFFERWLEGDKVPWD